MVNLGATPLLLEIGTAGNQIGGSGLVHDQVDSMIVKRLRAISVTYDPNAMPAPQGLIHTSTNP